MYLRLWPTKSYIHHRSLINNCMSFVVMCFIFTYVQIIYSHTSDSTSFDAQEVSMSHKQFFDHLQPFHYPVSCSKLFKNDSDEVQHALNLLSKLNHTSMITDDQYNISKSQCNLYRSERFNESFHFEDTPINQQFPLAFNILMHENVQQFERLLRLIYRPQNFYCIHVDRAASPIVFEGVQSIVQCFDNVFVASRREKVLYATISRLQADLNCMQDHLKYPSWKYLLNIANSELPLKTNSELVEILSIYRGYNDIEGRWKSRNMRRVEYVWELINTSGNSYARHLRLTNGRKKPPPGNVEIVKGSAYGAFSRAFVEFIQTNPVAQELFEWSRDTYSPDEHYWATLNYNTHLNTPGGYQAKSDPTNWTARFVNWGEYKCYGQRLRGICVFGTGDLSILSNRYELFANKFHSHDDPIAYQCLEELIINKSKTDLPLNDTTYYQQMPFLSQS